MYFNTRGITCYFKKNIRMCSLRICRLRCSDMLMPLLVACVLTALPWCRSKQVDIYHAQILIIIVLMQHTLLPCAVESHPTPDDSRGSSSPYRSIPGVSSHVADGGSARIPLECVQPFLSCSSSPSRTIHSPSITSSSIPPALTTCPK